MPSIAQQLRTDRRRRDRRVRVVLGVLFAVPAVLAGVRLATEVRADAAGATAPGGTTTAMDTTTSMAAPPLPQGLQPGLVAAFERARVAAADAGHELTITSGYRTATEQAALLADEVAERGSLAEALWWVFPPDRSMHVQGLAIDVGDDGAAGWLDDEGDRFGLCRTLDWEWWHFEWRAEWEADRSCPAPARTPAEAPEATLRAR